MKVSPSTRVAPPAAVLGSRTTASSGGWAVATPAGWRAFTLLEVMIAMAIFFMAIFAILGLVSQNLQIARSLSLGEIDVSTVAVELTLQTLTNREMSEGFVSGDFGETFPGATWNANLFLVSSNAGGLATRSSGGGLYQADITITWPQNQVVKERQTSLLLYRPNLGSRAAGR